MSTTIYSAILPVISKDKNKYNFVYQITEISTGIKYIGSHGTEKSNPLKALKKYKSSAKKFKKKQKYNPLNYYYEILSYHETRDEATLEESRLHFLYDVKCNPNYYNLSNQTPNGFSTSGKVVVKDEFGNTSLVNCNDPNYMSGELTQHSKGMITVRYKNNFIYITIDEYYLNKQLYTTISKDKQIVKDKDGNTSLVDNDDYRLKNGELVSINKDRISVKDKFNNYYQVNKDDPKYLSGEFVGVNKGNKLSNEHINKVVEKTTKKYSIMGKIYIGRQNASLNTGLSKHIITKRCKSEDPVFKDYFIIK